MISTEAAPYAVRLMQMAQKTQDYYYLPYSVGLLQAYAQKYVKRPERFRFLPPLYRRLSVNEALRAFQGVQIVGFSVYVWNIRRSLRLAQAIKAAQPQTLILLGGPQVPDRAEDFLRQHPFIDLCTHGAGEELFTQILDCYAQAPEAQGRSHWPALEGVSYLHNQNAERPAFVHQTPAPRARDLSAFPSPFLTDIFAPLLREHDKWMTTFESNRGCPFRCSFCDWGSATASRVARVEMQRVQAEVEWFGRQGIHSVFCADANFGMLKRDLEIAHAFARTRARYGYPRLLQIQTAKNVSARVVEIQQILKAAQLSATAAISVQSMSPTVLDAIQRENISQSVFQSLQETCLAQDIYSYTEVIVGLPGESYDSFAQGVAQILENGQLNKILFHNAALLPNAEMAQPEYRRRFGLKTVEVPMPYQNVDEDMETLEMIVGSASLSPEAWRGVQVFAWMTSLLFYTHKFLQLVLILLHDTLQVSYRNLIELFVWGDLREYPQWQRVQMRMHQSARLQQQGLPHCLQDELVQSRDGAYWHPALSLYEEACEHGKLEALFAEAAALLGRDALSQRRDYPLALLKEAFVLNRRVFEHMSRREDNTLSPQFLQRRPSQTNLADYFKARLQGKRISLWSHRQLNPESAQESFFQNQAVLPS